ncbi:uncharacterized protein [Centruroides vittatus]|uniref:uncharacterized protein n=1 Tax=Centruroides vittatus TaxID=120091 RepID=UPI00350F5288
MCLRKSIRIAKNKKYGILHELITLEDIIYNEDPEMLVEINRGIVKLTDTVHMNLKNKYIEKMKWILKKQASRVAKGNPSTFILWDQVEVSVKIREFLKWGPNFVPENSKSWETSIQEIERRISGLDSLEKEYLRWKTVIKDQTAWKKKCDASKYIKLTKGWLRKNNLITTRADKSKALVIMKRQTYNNALEEYIQKTECERVDEKIIDSVDRRVKKLEKAKLTNLLPFLKNCRNPRPGIPRLFAFAKTHKEGKEVRPIVERCRGPTFFLEKRLHKFLTSQLENNIYVAQDPRDVVNEIQDLILMEDEVGTVMDYESLYPSIKIESCKVALLDFMHSKSPDLANYSSDLIELANLVCYESFFAFNGRQYKQKRGVPMGSPMSGLLYELVLRRLEKSVLCGFMNDIVYFKRYVDDVLVIWKNDQKVEEFINKINNNDDGLKLKIEQTCSSRIHFLDIDIKFKEGHFVTKVYVKPTHSPLYIPSRSNDPYQYKMAAFRALIHRAFLYCSSVVDRQKEIYRISHIARTLGYRADMVTALIKNYKINKTKAQRGDFGKFTKFTYDRKKEAIMKEISARKNSKLIFKRAPNPYKLLRNDKDNIDKERMAGVYKIPYENQELGIYKNYIGVTNRNLGIRLREHRYNISKRSNATVLSQITQVEGSIVKWGEAGIIKPVHSPTLAFSAEKIEIF